MTKTAEKKTVVQDVIKNGWKFSGDSHGEYCIYCGSYENLREVNTVTQADEKDYEIVLHQFFICRRCGLNYHGLWIKSISNMVEQAIKQAALRMIECRVNKAIQERQAVKKHIKKRFNHTIEESAQVKQEQTGKIKKLVAVSAQNKKE